MASKILGYILVLLGLLAIAGVLWQSYAIYTGKASAPVVFTTPIPPQNQIGSQDIQGQINDAVKKQFDQIIPASSITKILNLSSWLFLSVIFIFAGGTVSSIGVKLINGNK